MQYTQVQPLVINPDSWHYRLYRQRIERIRQEAYVPERVKDAGSRCSYAEVVLSEVFREALMWFFVRPVAHFLGFNAYPFTVVLAILLVFLLFTAPRIALNSLVFLGGVYTFARDLRRAPKNRASTAKEMRSALLSAGLLMLGATLFIAQGESVVFILAPAFVFWAIWIVSFPLAWLYKWKENRQNKPRTDDKGASFVSIVLATLQGLWLHVCPPIVLPAEENVDDDGVEPAPTV